MPLQLPDPNAVGGSWGAGMYPDWFQQAIQNSGMNPAQAADVFAQYVSDPANHGLSFGWYWDSFKRGGENFGQNFGSSVAPQPEQPPPPGQPPPGQTPVRPTPTQGPPPGVDPHSGYYVWRNVNGQRTKVWVPRAAKPAPQTVPPVTKPAVPNLPPTTPPPTTDPPEPIGGQGPADPFARNASTGAPASVISQSNVMKSGTLAGSDNRRANTNPTPPPSAPLPSMTANTANKPPVVTKPAVPKPPTSTDPLEPSTGPAANSDVVKKKKAGGIGSAYL